MGPCDVNRLNRVGCGDDVESWLGSTIRRVADAASGFAVAANAKLETISFEPGQNTAAAQAETRRQSEETAAIVRELQETIKRQSSRAQQEK